jgi:stage V sporulation protein R
MRLFSYLEEMADKGRITYEFQRIQNAKSRSDFDRKTGQGLDYIFSVRENFSDFTFLNTFLDQDFMDRHKLFVAGRRLNGSKGVWEYYIKSKKIAHYKEMLLESLYHPPCIEIDEEKSMGGDLYLTHRFEGRPLVREYIENTMLGIEYLWGGPVKLETTDMQEGKEDADMGAYSYLTQAYTVDDDSKKRVQLIRILYTMAGRKLTRAAL